MTDNAVQVLNMALVNLQKQIDDLRGVPRRDPVAITELTFRDPTLLPDDWELIDRVAAGAGLAIHYIPPGSPAWPNHYRLIVLGDQPKTIFIPADWCSARKAER